MPHPEPSEALLPDALLRVLQRVEELPPDAAGALIFGDEADPRGLVLADRRRICWAEAAGLPGRLREFVARSRATAHEVDDLGGALASAQEVLRRYEAGDQQLKGLLVEHCCEAIDSLAQFDGEPGWVERSRTYDPKFSLAPADVLGGVSRLTRPDLTDTCTAVLRPFEKNASVVALAAPGRGSPCRFVAAVDGAGIGVQRLGRLAEWGDEALTRAQPLAMGLRQVFFESRRHGSTCAWVRGGIAYVGWAPDGRTLAATLTQT